MKTHPAFVVLTFACAPAILLGAFAVGGVAYTKRPETKILAEPLAVADTAARVGYGKALKIEEVKGRWLRVSDGKTKGWVFAGNVAEEQPAEVQGLDGLPFAASEATATAAARPLTPAAVEYGSRRGLAKANDDVKWLVATSDAITAAQIEEFLKEQKKGEFQ